MCRVSSGPLKVYNCKLESFGFEQKAWKTAFTLFLLIWPVVYKCFACTAFSMACVIVVLRRGKYVQSKTMLWRFNLAH